jgi:hypothetical protein
MIDRFENILGIITEPSMFGIEWWSGFDPQNSGAQMAKFNEATFKGCVSSLFGIDPDTVRFTPTQPGQNGMFIGYLFGDTARNNEIGVVNDVSYNSTQLGHMTLSPSARDGGTILGVGGRPDGKGFATYSPYRNYTASNLTNQALITVIQIHELGHSLSWITGKHPTPKHHKDDPGRALEECVFGGDVNRYGRIE